MATTISFDTDISVSHKRTYPGLKEFFVDVMRDEDVEDIVLGMYVKQQVDQGDYPLATQEETTDFLAALSHLAA